MKNWFSTFRLTLLLALLTFLVPQTNYAAIRSDAVPNHVVSAIPSPTTDHATKTTRHHSRFWAKAKQKWQQTKAWFNTLLDGEPASTLAKVALYLFCGSIVLAIITSLVFSSVAIISLPLLASIIISFIVLFSDENKKSKAIAKTILIIAGVLILLFIIFLALFLVFNRD